METVKKDHLVILTLRDKTYRGVVHFVSKDREMLRLKKVVAIQGMNEIELGNNLNFFKGEIIDLKILQNEMNSGSEEKKTETKRDSSSKRKVGEIRGVLPSRPTSVSLVDSWSKFETVMKILEKVTVIGLSFEGYQLGRYGSLGLVCVATETNIFHFDVIKLKEECFQRGLRALLESSRIMKVVYDCRLASDCLYNKYEVQLRNVYDAQVMDLNIQKEQGVNPPKAKDLTTCLKEYLGITKAEADMIGSGFPNPSSKKNIPWVERPLTDNLLKIASKRVRSLRVLRITQMDVYMHRFVRGVDVYLSTIRDASDDDAIIFGLKTSHVPQELISVMDEPIVRQ